MPMTELSFIVSPLVILTDLLDDTVSYRFKGRDSPCSLSLLLWMEDKRDDTANLMIIAFLSVFFRSFTRWVMVEQALFNHDIT